jgi:hypothetical protein
MRSSGDITKWQQNVLPGSVLVASASQWRTKFKQGLEGLEIAELGFKPYSLRMWGRDILACP